jgi:L-aspartate oxidase
MMGEILETEVLIIGCGIAGGTAALQLALAGIPVTVVTRARDPKESNTVYAQGGIIYKGDGDTPELLAEDLIRTGAEFCNPLAVMILAEEGPGLVEKILIGHLGIPFDRSDDDEFSFVKEGGHSVSRILHFKDYTGSAIQKGLIKALKDHPNVNLLTNHTAVDLVTPSHHSLDRLAVYEPRSCSGAYLFNQETESTTLCLAKKTILATGGLGNIFLRTSNPSWACGDGLAMADRAGARAINCEFIQFHPTTFHYKNSPHFLISESVRGAGARLISNAGEPFMKKYSPDWGDLAARDVVSRSIDEEMMVHDLQCVYLDLYSYMSAEEIKGKFPTIYQNCLEWEVDITQEPIPVVPAAHYSCGGVWVDMWGETAISHLYAIGEVACTGLHGANRLASSSLLEGLVWGVRSAEHIRETLPKRRMPNKNAYPLWEEPGTEKPDPSLISQDMISIKNVMWNYVGLVRTTNRLGRALRELRNLEFEIENFYRASRLTDSLIRLRNSVRTAKIVATSAWMNKKSKGCHYRV